MKVILGIEKKLTSEIVDSKKIEKTIDFAKKAISGRSERISVAENGIVRCFNVGLKGVGPIKNQFGDFWFYNFFIDDQWKNYSVIVKAKEIDEETLNPVFANKKQLIIRIDSGCMTGQLFGDVTCECREQLDLAQKIIGQNEGMVIHISGQDGRGMGVPFKLATLFLQKELGIDTIRAASLLASGGTIDARTYSGVICILKFFGIFSECKIRLATNNLKKALIFSDNGYILEDYLAVRIKPNPETIMHLLAKQEYLGHNLQIVF